MDKINVDFSISKGKMKPMHSVNNGPAHKFHTNDQTASNLQAFRIAELTTHHFMQLTAASIPLT